MDSKSPILELILEKTITPSSPTPVSLKTYKFSYIDQLCTDKYTPIALFYPNHCFTSSNNNDNISSHIQESLSDLLSIYYPFAGRLVGDNVSVECNDMGAIFKEVRINVTLSEMLKKPHSFVEKQVFPKGLAWRSSKEGGSLIVAQLTHFECGGLALGLCMSHKIADGFSTYDFFNHWATISRGHDLQSTPAPIFDGARLFPPIQDFGNQAPAAYEMKVQQHISMRIIFTAERINKLKTMVSEDEESGVRNPTRTEIVTAFLTKYNLMAATFKPVVLFITVNLRSHINPPLEGSWIGNIVSFIAISISEEKDLNMATLIRNIRSEKLKISKRFKGLRYDQLLEAASEDMKRFEEIAKRGVEFYSVASSCNIPFYGVDFGWGKPEWVTVASLPKKNYFFLLDDFNGGGVEAIGSIDERVLPMLEKDEDFLSFCFY